MLRYKPITIPTGNSENLADALSGIGERKRKIHKFILDWTGTSGGVSTGDKVRVYLEQDRIVDYPITAWIDGDSDANPLLIRDIPTEIPMDLTLEVGQSLQAGNFNASVTSPTFDLIMVYEDL